MTYELPPDGPYNIAMLKVAIEMKKQHDASFENVVSQVARTMKLDPHRLKHHLAGHMRSFVNSTKTRGS